MNRILTFIILSLVSFTLAGQDPVFSQFYAAPLRLNPAFAGISVAPRVNINYRTQYTAWPNAYRTFAVSYEQPFDNKPYALGVSVMSDIQADGAYRNNYISAVYSYEIQLADEVFARGGLSAGLLQSQVDFSQLVFGDVLDPVDGNTGATTEEELAFGSKTSFDAGAGILIFAKSVYVGMSVDHLNQPDESLLEINPTLYAGRPWRLNIHAGGQIKLKRYSNRRRPSYVSPSIMYARQARFQQLTMGAYFGWGPLFLGGYYRHAFENADALIGLVGVKQGVFRIGYSYDATLSALRNVSGGAGAVHEIGVSFDFGDSVELARRKHRSRYNNCFGMFN